MLSSPFVVVVAVAIVVVVLVVAVAVIPCDAHCHGRRRCGRLRCCRCQRLPLPTIAVVNDRCCDYCQRLPTIAVVAAIVNDSRSL